MGRRLLQTERNAGLLIEVLRSLVAERAFELHDFVIMPDHVHLLLTVHEAMTVEKAMQLIKGRFSFRLKKEFGVQGEVWQRGFSEVQVMNRENFETQIHFGQPSESRIGRFGGELSVLLWLFGEIESASSTAGAKALVSLRQIRHD